ncbi:HNH endonuclease [Paenibacillus sp. FSL H8-0168]|uniref:HNH endonuclease n=1 Tax=Paenibacillus sp. FSL H8-0168 TaxID=2921378 RepID=UPI003158240A
MPSRPKRQCARPGCRELTTESYCEKHKVQHVRQVEQQRGTAAQRGYDHKWRKTRIGFLRKHPLCVRCLAVDKLTPATVVDHIIPHKGNKELFWQRDNWQALCKACHDVKTATEDGGFGNG